MEQSLNAFVEPANDEPVVTEAVDTDSAARDTAVDLQVEEARGSFTPETPTNGQPASSGPQSPLISIEEATTRIGPKVLATLEAKFKGSLTQVRATDENDLLF